MPTRSEIRITPGEGIKRIEPGDKLGETIAEALLRNILELRNDTMPNVEEVHAPLPPANPDASKRTPRRAWRVRPGGGWPS